MVHQACDSVDDEEESRAGSEDSGSDTDMDSGSNEQFSLEEKLLFAERFEEGYDLPDPLVLQ